MADPPLPAHLVNLVGNIKEVRRLIDIHERISGKAAGRRYALEVLNKSAVVLLVACWENFVEELARAAFTALLKQAAQPDVFPKKVLALASRDIKAEKDDASVWKLAGNGWRAVLEAHAGEVLKRHLGPFHAPDSENIASMFQKLVGITDIRNLWHWTGMTRARAVNKLDRLVALRHAIAHKVKAPASVRKVTVVDFTAFILRLAGVTNNAVSMHIRVRTTDFPWGLFKWTG